MLNEARGGRKEHVRRDRSDHDGLDSTRINAALRQGDFGGFNRQVASRHAFIHDVPLADARTAQNPLVAGFNNFFEILIGKHARRNVGPQGSDLGAPHLAHSVQFSSLRYGNVIVRSGCTNSNQ